MCLFAEWSSLHHVDEAWLELKLEIVGFECWSSVDVLSAWSRVFLAMTSRTGVELPLNSVYSD